MSTRPDVEVEDWSRRRTIGPVERAIPQLTDLKNAARARVSVCLPALDESETIGRICRTIVDDLVKPGIADELIVVDSGSSDGTQEIALDAGATVHAADEILPELPAGVDRPGKGDALWKSLGVSSGDVVVWLDSDVRNFSSQFAARLLWPLLEDPDLVMSKAFYDRPLERPETPNYERGGRVTELAARPLLQMVYPRLGGVIQPLSGEYALRRAAALEIPFVTGYGVDVALLIDVVARFGLDAIAQVDLGSRLHRNRDLLALGRTSFQVVGAILARLRDLGVIDFSQEPPTSLRQFLEQDASGGFTTELAMATRPPMGALPRS